MGQVIISLSREYGSGGHDIALEIAKRYGIAFYDHAILDNIARESGVDVDVIKNIEKKDVPVLSGIFKGGSAQEENIVRIQSDYLRDLVEAGESMVVVGRCSEYIFRDYDCMISIFVSGDHDKRVERIVDKYKISKEEAEHKVARHDKSRSEYHNKYTKSVWGYAGAYEFCINSSKLGYDATTDLICEYIDKRIAELG